jgi:hypothetical protein
MTRPSYLIAALAALTACAANNPATTEDGTGGEPAAADGGRGGKSSGTGGARGGTGGRSGTGGTSASGGAAGADQGAGGEPMGDGGASGGDAGADASSGDGGAAGGAGEPDAGAAGAGGQVDAGPPVPAHCVRTIQVTAPADLATKLGAAKPGDCLMVADGAYAGLAITAQGTQADPILVQAVHRLKASFSSTPTLMGAAWVTLEGFVLPGVKVTDSNHCRITRAQVTTGVGTGVIVNGKSDGTRIDHCDIGGGSTATDVMNPGGFSTNTLIDHNHFHDLHAPHTITLGCCGATYDYHDTGDVAEYNLFVNCMSGAELFSVKSSASTIRYNTVRNSAGDIDIRAGRHDVIHGNFVFNGAGNFGIRMYEDDHHIYNNYVESGRPLAVGPGHEGHAQVKNATIVFNTFIGRVSLGDDVSTNFSNNIVVGPITISAGLGGTAPIMPTYKDNIQFMGTGPMTGFKAIDPKLVRQGDVLALTAGSPAIGGATTSFPFVSDDMRGTPRGAKQDIGAEQLSSMPGMRRPLTTADVGPNAP